MMDNIPRMIEGSYRKGFLRFFIFLFPSTVLRNEDGTFTKYKVLGRFYWAWNDPYPTPKIKK